MVPKKGSLWCQVGQTEPFDANFSGTKDEVIHCDLPASLHLRSPLSISLDKTNWVEVVTYLTPIAFDIISVKPNFVETNTVNTLKLVNLRSLRNTAASLPLDLLRCGFYDAKNDQTLYSSVEQTPSNDF